MEKSLLHVTFQLRVLLNNFVILSHLLIEHLNHVISRLAFYLLRQNYLFIECPLILYSSISKVCCMIDSTIWVNIVASKILIHHHLFVLEVHWIELVKVG